MPAYSKPFANRFGLPPTARSSSAFEFCVLPPHAHARGLNSPQATVSGVKRFVAGASM